MTLLNMKSKYLISLLCAALMSTSSFALEIPLQLNDENWQSLHYKNIAPNVITQKEQGFEIKVNNSASPLIYVFDQPLLVKNIKVSGSMGDLPTIPADLTQGDKNADDFPFRIGLVLAGDKTLNFAKRLIAPNWVKTLYALAPKGYGIDHIAFLNLANPEPISWQSRDHPASKGLFKETIVAHIQPNEDFELKHDLSQPNEVIALWISSDGDDTNSSFSLNLNSITLND